MALKKFNANTTIVGQVGVVDPSGYARAQTAASKAATLGLNQISEFAESSLTKQRTLEAKNAAALTTLVRDENENLIMPKLEGALDTYSIFGQEYNDAIKDKYSIEIKSDIRSALSTMYNENLEDPAQFKKVASAYIDATLDATHPEVFTSVAESTGALFDQYSVTLDNNLAKRQIEKSDSLAQAEVKHEINDAFNKTPFDIGVDGTDQYIKEQINNIYNLSYYQKNPKAAEDAIRKIKLNLTSSWVNKTFFGLGTSTARKAFIADFSKKQAGMSENLKNIVGLDLTDGERASVVTVLNALDATIEQEERQNKIDQEDSLMSVLVEHSLKALDESDPEQAKYIRENLLGVFPSNEETAEMRAKAMNFFARLYKDTGDNNLARAMSAFMTPTEMAIKMMEEFNLPQSLISKVIAATRAQGDEENRQTTAKSLVDMVFARAENNGVPLTMTEEAIKKGLPWNNIYPLATAEFAKNVEAKNIRNSSDIHRAFANAAITPIANTKENRDKADNFYSTIMTNDQPSPNELAQGDLVVEPNLVGEIHKTKITPTKIINFLIKNMIEGNRDEIVKGLQLYRQITADAISGVNLKNALKNSTNGPQLNEAWRILDLAGPSPTNAIDGARAIATGEMNPATSGLDGVHGKTLNQKRELINLTVAKMITGINGTSDVSLFGAIGTAALNFSLGVTSNTEYGDEYRKEQKEIMDAFLGIVNNLKLPGEVNPVIDPEFLNDIYKVISVTANWSGVDANSKTGASKENSEREIQLAVINVLSSGRWGYSKLQNSGNDNLQQLVRNPIETQFTDIENNSNWLVPLLNSHLKTNAEWDEMTTGGKQPIDAVMEKNVFLRLNRITAAGPVYGFMMKTADGIAIMIPNKDNGHLTIDDLSGKLLEHNRQLSRAKNLERVKRLKELDIERGKRAITQDKENIIGKAGSGAKGTLDVDAAEKRALALDREAAN